MSYAIPEIADLVEPVDEELVEQSFTLASSPSGQRRRQLVHSWRAFGRLKDQAWQLEGTLVPPDGEQCGRLQQQVPCRQPKRQSSWARLIAARVPKPLDAYAPPRRKVRYRITPPSPSSRVAPGRQPVQAQLSRAPSPEDDATSRVTSVASRRPSGGVSRPASAASSRPVSSARGQTGRPLSAATHRSGAGATSLKSARTTTTATSVGPPSSAAASSRRHFRQRHLQQVAAPEQEELWSDGDDDPGQLIGDDRTSPRHRRSPSTSGGEESAAQSPVHARRAPRIPGLSPIERVGSLYHVCCRIRTRARDQKMDPIEYTRVYRGTEPSKPPTRKPSRALHGVFGKDPFLSHFLAIEEFDNIEHDRVEASGVSLLQRVRAAGTLGVQAQSLYLKQGVTTSDGEYEWRDCVVNGYKAKEDLWHIRWADGGKKWVRRLNLVITEEETLADWQHRVEAATALRDEAERKLRQYLFVDDMPDDLVTPVDDRQTDRIVELVATEFPSSLLPVVQRCLGEAQHLWLHSSKQAVYDYRMKDPREHERVADMNLPQPPEYDEGTTYTDLVSLMGTIEVCSPRAGEETAAQRFVKNRNFIANNLFFTHRILYHTIYRLVNVWSTFQTKPLFDSEMPDLQLPCELSDFRDRQKRYLASVTSRLKNEWTVLVVQIIQTDLIGHYNFYDDDGERFANGRMKRFLRVVNMIMGHQLKGLVDEAVEHFATFLVQYRASTADWTEAQEEESAGEPFQDDQGSLAPMSPVIQAAPSRRVSKRHSRVFMDLVGASAEIDLSTAPPEFRVSTVREEQQKRDVVRRSMDIRNARKSIGYDPDDESAPMPGTLAFIRARASLRKSLVDVSGDQLETPPEEVIQPPRAPVQDKSVSAAVSGNVSLVRISLTTDERGKTILYDPPLDEIENVIRGMLADFFLETDDITGVGEQLFPLLSLEPFRLTESTKVLREDDAGLRHAQELLTEVLRENMKAPTALKDLYDDFQYILDVDTEEYVEKFLDADPRPTLDDYNHLCERLQKDISAIGERSLNEVAFTLIKVECYQIKHRLAEKAKQIMNAIMERLTMQCNRMIQSVDERYSDIKREIAIQPETPEQLQQLKEYVDSVPKKLSQLSVDFDEITQTVQLLSRFEYIPEENSFKTYWATFGRPRQVIEKLDDFGYKYKENRNRFMNDLRENTEQLSEEISELRKRVEGLSYEDDEFKAELLFKTVQQMRRDISDFHDKAEKFNSHEKIFGMPVTKHTAIKEVSLQFEPYETLWTITQELAESHAKWYDHPLENLQADDVEFKANHWHKQLVKLNKQLAGEAPHIVVRAQKEKLEQFLPHIPLVTALREKGIKPRHWQQIGAMIGMDPKDVKTRLGGKDHPVDELTLKWLVEKGLGEKLLEVQALAEGASKEWRLEDQLEKMKAEWKNKQFELKPYQDTRMLHSVDDIQQLLDDHIVKTQMILGSLDVKHIEDNVRTWEETLLRMRSVIDEWLKCQNMWYYLEPIFSSVDIQKSLPTEATHFERVNLMFRTVMDHCATDARVQVRCTEERLQQSFEENNKTLEHVLKRLHMFLETKRQAFPRFYFLSNDDLLEILSETKDPLRIQKHLRKCFEGLSLLTFTDGMDITEMHSGEGETLKLVRRINPAEHDNLAERWLGRVEEAMLHTVRDYTEQALREYSASGAETSPTCRLQWMVQCPGQVAICVAQIFWTTECEAAIGDGVLGLQTYLKRAKLQLEAMVEGVRGKLGKVQRRTVEAMIVIEVHAVDIIESELLANRVDDINSFTWLAQLRYYWEEHTDQRRRKVTDVFVRQTNAVLPYGYEYLGNTGRLVITPLTDRCYRTLMGALHLGYGGAPEGPAGTGKTETTKDLAKALAKYCLVYNCSDQISHHEMAKMFRGLSACGAWACFDEFNRIEVQVLSVIAQQILTIQIAVGENRFEFEFEGQMNALKKGCSVFITMNPGYAGRAELPDNLKALFRPVAMMVPDYALIGQISLFSYGFKEGLDLARKIVATYRLCSEQLSSQTHYDYGMRAVKTVLTAAGRLRAAEMERGKSEKQIILRAIHDVNYPKFLPEDLKLFESITKDLFPGVDLPAPDYAAMHDGLRYIAEQKGLQPTPVFLSKVCQVYEMILVRHGLMVVGASFGGKSCTLQVLADGLTWLHNERDMEDRAHINVVNPKSITSGQLYGANDAAMEWNDGVLSNIFRTASNATDPDRHWLVLDGPVDAIWIENMNTVLDDNKKLCLINGDIIHMTNKMNMIFEVADLLVASPATVSRCGMIYFDPEELGWGVLVDSWRPLVPEHLQQNAECHAALFDVLDHLLPTGLDWVRAHGKFMAGVTVSDHALVASVLRTVLIFLRRTWTEENTARNDQRDLVTWVEGHVIFSIVWVLGGCLDLKSRRGFSELLATLAKGAKQDQFKKTPERTPTDAVSPTSPPQQGHEYLIALPDLTKETLFEYCFQIPQEPGAGIWTDWLYTQPDQKLPEEATFHEIIVPTPDTIRHSYLLDLLLPEGFPVMVLGGTGTGKTILIKEVIHALENPPEGVQPTFTHNFVQFSARTTANQTQEMLERKLERRRRGVIGAPQGRKCVLFVDDLALPDVEDSGAQPAIELLRQWLDYKGWYDHSKGNVGFKTAEGLHLVGAYQPGRNEVSQRFLRHFNMLAIPDFSDDTMKKIFSTLLDWVMQTQSFDPSFRGMRDLVVMATLDMYNTVTQKLLPTPEKPHYSFNLRDVSRVIQGMGLCSGRSLPDDSAFLRLWVHECCRVFQDRLTTDADRAWYRGVLGKAMQGNLKRTLESVAERNLVYGDFIHGPESEEDRLYQELTDLTAAKKVLELFQTDHNTPMPPSGSGPLDLVIFGYVLEHVARICRIIQQPQGNALLIGVGGSGRQSATRLATHVAGYRLYQIKLKKNYGHDAWRDDVKQCVRDAAAGPAQGGKGPTTFLLTDTQIKEESFLEDISNLLNTGEIPNLFEEEELEPVYAGLAKRARDMGRKDLGREGQKAMFLQRTKQELHTVLCFSPIGTVLRTRLRMFPALVNCSTIDYFAPWPEEGLQAVGELALEGKSHGLEHMTRGEKEAVVAIFVQMDASAKKASVAYLQQHRQHTYVTPASYLELIYSFKHLLALKRRKAETLRDRYKQGLEQLQKTEDSVDRMREQLEIQKPKLREMAESTAVLISRIEKDEADADVTRRAVAKEEAAANAVADEARKIKEGCEAVLAKAMPALDAAMAQVQEIDKKQLVEVRSMTNPSDKIKQVMGAVCVCLGQRPIMEPDPANPKRKRPDYWTPSKRLMADTNEFLNTLLTYKDREDGLDGAIFEGETGTIQPYIRDKNFTPERVKGLSRALAPVCQWVIAMERFYQVDKKVKPRRAELARAQAEFDAAMAQLTEKKAELQRIDDGLNEMRAHLRDSQNERDSLEAQFDDTEKKLDRAQKVISGLGGERERYVEQSDVQQRQLGNLLGDVLLSAAHLAYLSPLTQDLRKQLLEQWTAAIRTVDLPMSKSFDFAGFLGEDVEIQKWKLQGLPADSFSVDNAIIVENTRRWALMIDPQQQASSWIRERWREKLHVLRPSEEGYVQSIASAVRSGYSVLLQNIDEDIDPVLNPLLTKQFTVNPQSASGFVVQIGDQTVEVHRTWTELTPPESRARFFLTTKLPRPHYKPEISTKVCLVAFMITPIGLQDQLVQRIVQFEDRDLEEKKQKNVRLGAQNKAKLKTMEDRILEHLSAEGNLLENEAAIVALNDAQKTAEETATSQKEVDRIVGMFNKARKRFLYTAGQAAGLFFCTTELCNIDPMYQYSLQWYLALFQKSLEQSKLERERETLDASRVDAEQRNKDICTHFFYALCKNISRSVFAKDRLLFAFMMACSLSQDISPEQVRFLCTVGVDKEWSGPPLRQPPWLPEQTWRNVLRLSEQMPKPFKELAAQLSQADPEARRGAAWLEWFNHAQPHAQPFPSSWEAQFRGDGLPALHRLMLVRVLRPDRLVPAIIRFVSEHPELGTKYTDPPLFNLADIFQESSNPAQPLIFVLSSGADPMAQLRKLAFDEGMDQRMQALSLGQGMKDRAERMIQDGRTGGGWVVLQNCHLYKDWMPQLERTIEEYTVSKQQQIHRDYRLWLTSMPSPDFPVAVLMNGTKMIVEPPKGLRQNMLGSYCSAPLSDQEFFDGHSKPTPWKRLCFALCFYHAVIQERRAFGPLGWNIPYEFNATDLVISLKQLHAFIGEYDQIPFAALTYLAGECNYGGRVTDDRDRRCLMAMLRGYYTEQVLTGDFELDRESRQYPIPAEGRHEDYCAFIQGLPTMTPPSVFGLHANADIAKDERETRLLLSALLVTQPRTAAAAGEGEEAADPKEQVLEVARTLAAKLPDLFDVESARREYPVTYTESMNTVLTMELQRYNNLLRVVRRTLHSLQRAIKGEIVLDNNLEGMLNDMLDGRIPRLWLRRSHPSLKPLGAYVTDLCDRLGFLSHWVQHGAPVVFWLSGFFFTQSFLTGVQQNFARRHNLEIDTLSWEFEYLSGMTEEGLEKPDSGCYIRGLFLEGAGWEDATSSLRESDHKVLHVPFPIVHLRPTQKPRSGMDEAGLFGALYKAPLYKTSERRGILSTTGHNSNFVMPFLVPVPPEGYAADPAHWVKRGVALLCQLDY
eukprot:TRINITY_DN7573_c0_g3_i1.p1 TRINITY_DN7573_c0_g3~~TRINITY_DN7573_c0_g3_i1.p1  ORF type:complete len:4614 (+),score=1785.85 TRINITY_DN7573_c0_g3_i1:132-13973(+)